MKENKIIIPSPTECKTVYMHSLTNFLFSHSVATASEDTHSNCHPEVIVEPGQNLPVSAFTKIGTKPARFGRAWMWLITVSTALWKKKKNY